MTRGIAYDGAFVNDATVAAAKAKGALAFNCYITRDTSCDPGMAHKHGLGSIATYEHSAGELVGMSRTGGQAVGRTILAALIGKGYPTDRTVAVYPSVDVQVSAGNAAACDQAMLGIKDVIGGKFLLHVYAEGAVIKHLYEAKIIDGPGWLSGSTSFPGWHEAASATYVCMVQAVGSDIHSTDRNTVTNAEALGAWWPAGSPFIPTEKDWFDMATEAQLKAIIDASVKAHIDPLAKKLDVMSTTHDGRNDHTIETMAAFGAGKDLAEATAQWDALEAKDKK